MATMKKQEEYRITKELSEIILTTWPAVNDPIRTFTSIGLCLNSCDEVYPNVYIGDSYSAKNKGYLKELGITHVLNAAEGKLPGMVDTDSDYYKYAGIKYLGLHLTDLPVADITQHFYKASYFIHEAVSSSGKVLVHCLMGLSRSSTCVLAYLIIHQGMSAANALKHVRTNREIRPNNGFLKQLAELDVKLKRTRFLSVI